MFQLYIYTLSHVSMCRIEDGPDAFHGVKCGNVLITYKMIWWDVRTSVDWLHLQVYYTGLQPSHGCRSHLSLKLSTLCGLCGVFFKTTTATVLYQLLFLQGGVKEETLKNLERYVVKDSRLPMCIHKYADNWPVWHSE